MKILIRHARIIDTHSPFNGLIKDILVDNDQIIAITDQITDAVDQIIESADWSFYMSMTSSLQVQQNLSVRW